MVIPMEKETRVEEGDILDKQYDTENNCIENLSKQMSLHPAYLKAFQRTEQFLMSGNGPLPFTHRHYIAIMASGRHQCETLVQLESAAFRAVGGDENWLTQGLQAAPSKLSRLCTLNNLLAHRPWLIQRHHIEELTTSNVKCSWSLSELMQAITILSQYHALSSFVFSCAINTGNNSMCLSNLLKRLKQEKKVSEYSEEELIESFKYIENQDLKYSMNKPQPNSNRCTNGGIGARLQRDPGFAYEDFAKRSTATSTLDSSGGRHATPQPRPHTHILRIKRTPHLTHASPPLTSSSPQSLSPVTKQCAPIIANS